MGERHFRRISFSAFVSFGAFRGQPISASRLNKDAAIGAPPITYAAGEINTEGVESSSPGLVQREERLPWETPSPEPTRKELKPSSFAAD